MLGTLTGSRDQRSSSSCRTRPCFVNADPSQFDTALVNMAVNARDAMDGEGTADDRGAAASTRSRRCARIRRCPAHFVAVSITDTGGGIPPDQLERIFEPFFTTKGVGPGHRPRAEPGVRLRQAVGRRGRRRERGRRGHDLHALPAARGRQRSRRAGRWRSLGGAGRSATAPACWWSRTTPRSAPSPPRRWPSLATTPSLASQRRGSAGRAGQGRRPRSTWCSPTW